MKAPGFGTFRVDDWNQAECFGGSSTTHGHRGPAALAPPPPLPPTQQAAQLCESDPSSGSFSQRLLFPTGHHDGSGETHPALRGSGSFPALIPLLLGFSSNPRRKCRCRWFCRAPAVRSAGPRSTASRLTGLDPAACPLLRG